MKKVNITQVALYTQADLSPLPPESLSQAVSFKEASGQKAGTATPNSDHTVKSCVLKFYV